MPPTRAQAIARCRESLSASLAGYRRELESLDEAARRETKSSAGDKYETAREMIAQGRRLVERSLSEAETGLAALERMEAAPDSAVCGFGSLAETSLGWYLVGASLGDADCGGVTVRSISLASPLGQALKGRLAGERVPWRGGELAVLSLS